MGKLPLASIIVPVYNDEDTIEVCLRTLVRQTYPVKEIIVVNDGSTDSTASVLSKMAQDYPALHIIHTRHGGITKARNIGIKHTRGEVVFFGEGDAIYNKNYMTKAVESLMSNPRMGGVCLTGAPWVVRSTLVTECIDVENRIKHRLLEEGKMQPYYAWIFRREAVEAAGGFDERLSQAEDKDIFLRVKKAGYSIGIVPGVNWRHRRDQDVWTYMRRNYVGGKTRILYLLKHRKVREFIQSVGWFWLLILAIPSVLIFPPFSYAILLALVLPMIYKLIFTLIFGWNLVSRKRYLFLNPLLSAIRYVSTAVGYTYGLIIVFFKKLAKKTVDWSSM